MLANHNKVVLVTYVYLRKSYFCFLHTEVFASSGVTKIMQPVVRDGFTVEEGNRRWRGGRSGTPYSSASLEGG